jgi:hypothetical protein
LRTKIIQLLSSTANGCLSELGYFPGMPEQFQQILQTNAALQNDNAKLFEDNRALARVVAMQNDRLAFLAGEDDVKLKQLAEMRDKIESLSMEQAKLKQTNEMLQATPVAQRYRQLFAESQMLRIKNDALERDFICLRDSYSALHNTAAEKGTLPSGQVAPGPLVQQIRRITGKRSLRLLTFTHPHLHLNVQRCQMCRRTEINEVPLILRHKWHRNTLIPTIKSSIEGDHLKGCPRWRLGTLPRKIT